MSREISPELERLIKEKNSSAIRKAQEAITEEFYEKYSDRIISMGAMYNAGVGTTAWEMQQYMRRCREAAQDAQD